MAMKKARIKVPRKAKKGDLIKIKSMIIHPMNNGFGKDKSGATIPRDLVNTLEVTFNGAPVMSTKMYHSQSKNPYHVFYVKVEESGTFEFTWTDDSGAQLKKSKKIVVQ